MTVQSTSTRASSYLEQSALVVLSAVLVDALTQESVEPLQLLQAVAGALLHHQVQEVLRGVVKTPQLLKTSPLGCQAQFHEAGNVGGSTLQGGVTLAAVWRRYRGLCEANHQFASPLTALIKTLWSGVGHL